MKKNKLLLSLFMFLIAFSAFFCGINTKNVFADNSSAFIQITDLNEISNDLTASYQLTNNFDATNFTGIVGTFTGTLDGNGYNIYGSLTNPIFQKIGEGASVYNLSFSPQKLDVEGSTQYSTISYSIFETEDTAEQNIGLLAGIISGAEISQIKISGVNLNTAVTTIAGDSGSQTKIHALKNNTNLGYLAGKANYGAQISNCVVESSTFNVVIGETVSNDFNFGGLIGRIDNATVSSSIVNLYKETSGAPNVTITISSDYSKTVNFGGISGFADDSKNYLYNNLVLLNDKNIQASNAIDVCNIGSIFGNLNFEQNASNIKGIVTTYMGEYFGTRVSNSVNYSLLSKIEYASLTSAVFADSTYWCDLEDYKWDYTNIWKASAVAKYPILQCFESYAVSFNAEESLKSLNLEVMPEVEDNDYSTIVSSHLSVNTEPTDASTSALENVEYGSTVYIKAEISTDKYYNKFFFISGLQLNGKTIYDNETGNKTTDINVSIHSTDENSYIYKINSFNANCEGEYNILLGRNTFKLNVYVYDLGTEETGSLIPGKFKTNSETNPVQEKVLDMQYGEKFILNTSVTNTDYSDKANWFIFDNLAKDIFDQQVVFEPVEENANFYASKIEFTFNETCEIFKNQNEDSKTYFDMASYQETTVNDATTSNFDLVLVYNKRVKEVKIVFRTPDGEEINEQIAKLLIDNKNDRLTWNEEEGVYYAKVAFDKGSVTEYTLKVETMDTNYKFLSWTYDIGKLMIPEDDEEAGIFEIAEDTEEPLVIYLELEAGSSDNANNLLWLWIILGAIGVAIIVVIVIVIVKKRGSGGSSYKKYYY